MSVMASEIRRIPSDCTNLSSIAPFHPLNSIFKKKTFSTAGIRRNGFI